MFALPYSILLHLMTRVPWDKIPSIFFPSIYNRLLVFISYTIDIQTRQMLFAVSLLIVSASTLTAAANKNGNCLATTGPEYKCNQYIYSHCKDASLVINKPQWDSCKQVELFWDQPTYNLTLTFIAPSKFKKAKGKSYQFCLQRTITMCDQPFYRLSNSQEKKVQWTGQSPACFKNEKGGNSFTFRFQSGDRLNCYGDFIRYSFKQ
jgi:hypothetical protein